MADESVKSTPAFQDACMLQSKVYHPSKRNKLRQQCLHAFNDTNNIFRFQNKLLVKITQIKL